MSTEVKWGIRHNGGSSRDQRPRNKCGEYNTAHTLTLKQTWTGICRFTLKVCGKAMMMMMMITMSMVLVSDWIWIWIWYWCWRLFVWLFLRCYYLCDCVCVSVIFNTSEKFIYICVCVFGECTLSSVVHHVEEFMLRICENVCFFLSARKYTLFSLNLWNLLF